MKKEYVILTANSRYTKSFNSLKSVLTFAQENYEVYSVVERGNGEIYNRDKPKTNTTTKFFDSGNFSHAIIEIKENIKTTTYYSKWNDSYNEITVEKIS